MKTQTINTLYSSFFLWAENLLAQQDNYTNVNSLLYSINDDRLKGKSVYGSPYRSWIYDSSITNAQIPSGVYSNGNFIPRGQSGLRLDFNNGRVIFSGGVNIPVSGQFSPKEFNLYATTKSDQELIFQQRIDFASQFPQFPSGIPSDKVIAPAIFIRFGNFETDSFALGGEYLDKLIARAVVLSDSNFSLEAVGNIFVNQKENNFLVFNQTPFDEYGDLKSGYFNYEDCLNQYYDPMKLAYISDVDFTKFQPPNPSNPDLRIGFVDFVISLTRFSAK